MMAQLFSGYKYPWWILIKWFLNVWTALSPGHLSHRPAGCIQAYNLSWVILLREGWVNKKEYTYDLYTPNNLYKLILKMGDGVLQLVKVDSKNNFLLKLYLYVS